MGTRDCRVYGWLWSWLPLMVAALACPSSGAQDLAVSQKGEKPRYLIVHADDAGMSHAVNVGTQQGLESGIVTSASIMVPCPWFKEFAQFAKANPQYDYGIHLTLTSEWDVYRWGPVASRDKVPSLLDEEDYLWDNSALVAANVKAEEVEIELRAQIDRAIEFGVPLSHLDTHMGSLFSRPDLVDVYIRLGLAYDLPVLFLGSMDPELTQAFPALAERLNEAHEKLKARNFPVLDKVLQLYGGDVPEQRERNYYEQIAQIGEGVTELIIHCGVDNDELRGITTSSARRNQDRVLFTDPKMKAFLDERGIQLIDWRKFRELSQPKD